MTIYNKNCLGPIIMGAKDDMPLRHSLDTVRKIDRCLVFTGDYGWWEEGVPTPGSG